MKSPLESKTTSTTADARRRDEEAASTKHGTDATRASEVAETWDEVEKVVDVQEEEESIHSEVVAKHRVW